MNLFLYFFSILPLFFLCDAFNVLVLFTHPGKSHFMIYSPVFSGLASRGHNVTVVSYNPQKKTIPYYRDVTLGNECVKKGSEVMSLELFKDMRRLRWLSGLFILERYIEKSCAETYEIEEFQKFLEEDHNYDVVLVQYFISECVLGLVKKINAPFIGEFVFLFQFFLC